MLFDLRQSADVEFKSLIVLALDLEFGLELLNQEFEARDFDAEFLNFRGGGGGARRSDRGSRCMRN